MHHWCTKTCSSYANHFSDVMRDHATKEAFQHTFLMEAILALTSLHIAVEATTTTPSSNPHAHSARQHVSAALRYQNRAVSGLQLAFANVTSSNCSAILLTSLLLLACATVSPLVPASGNEEIKPTAEAFLTLIHFIKGIKQMVQQFRPWFSESPLGAVIWDRTRFSEMPKCRPFPSMKLHELNDSMALVNASDSRPLPFEPSSSPFASFRPIEEGRDTLANPYPPSPPAYSFPPAVSLSQTSPIRSSSSQHAIFRDAITKLEYLFENGTSMLPWLAHVGSPFLNELSRGEPMAEAIFMHWGVFLDRLDDMWWAKYSGKRLVEELAGSLEGKGKRWRGVIEWCRGEVGVGS